VLQNQSVLVCVFVCVCVFVLVALVTQHAIGLRLIVLLYTSSLAVTYLSPLTHKQRGFQKMFIEHKMSVDFLYSFCVKCFSG
jgi:hypothetical protein